MKNITKISAAFIALFLGVNAFAAAEYASVGVQEGNIRSCASVKCKIAFKVWKYTPLKMLSVSKDKNWVEVKDFQGFKGWINKNLLSETPGLSAKSDANIRVSPSSDAEVAWIVQEGYPLKFIKKQGKWLQVEGTDGVKGWIHSSVVWGFLEYKK